MTASPPPEDSSLNRKGDSSSTRTPRRAALSAAVTEAERYPASAARFREFFPRTTRSVIARILQAILAECPDGTDEDVAAAVNVKPNQNSPGLWVCTMPDRVRNVILRRIAATPPVLKCQQCRDAGMVWDDENRASWCPADCDAAVVQRRAHPGFVAEWNSQFAGPPRNAGDISPIVGPKPPAPETGLAPRREAVE